MSGIGGWAYLQRTQEAQQAVFNKSPLMNREIEYFRENISKATTVEDLVGDRMLLKVALGAFGLDEDINKQAYIKKVLEEGTDAEDAFANRVLDPAYASLSKTFGYGNELGARIGQSDFANKIIDQYRVRQFEVAVGENDNAMRLAMNFKRTIKSFASNDDPERAGWFAAMGSKPVRTVLQGALGLPESIAFVEIDKQLDFFKDAASKKLGSDSIDVLLDDEVIETAIKDFLLREQLKNGPAATTPGSGALTLMQNAVINGQSAINLFQSNF